MSLALYDGVALFRFRFSDLGDSLQLSYSVQLYSSREVQVDIGMEKQNVGRWMFASGIVASVSLVAWFVLMFFTAPTGFIVEQLQRLAEQSTLYQWSFVNSSLVSLAFVTMMVLLALFVETERPKGVLEIVGVVFLAPYTLLVSIAYASQYTLFPRLLAEFGAMDKMLAKAWYFNNPSSIPYFLDYLGYAFFAISAFAIAPGLIRGKGLQKATGWLLLLTGLTSFAGFMGLAIGNPVIEMILVLGGVLSLPFAILVAVWAKTLIKQ